MQGQLTQGFLETGGGCPSRNDPRAAELGRGAEGWSPFAHCPPTRSSAQRGQPRGGFGEHFLPRTPQLSLVGGEWERGEHPDLGAARAEAHRPPLGASSLTPVEFLMSQGWYFPSSEGSRGTPLVAQCLRLRVPDVLGSSLIPGQGTKSCLLQQNRS